MEGSDDLGTSHTKRAKKRDQFQAVCRRNTMYVTSVEVLTIKALSTVNFSLDRIFCRSTSSVGFDFIEASSKAPACKDRVLTLL